MKILALLTLSSLAIAADFSAPAEVYHDDKLVLSYRAGWSGDYVVVQAKIEPSWHTFCMDNKRRQQEKLAGKPSLGIEKSTEIHGEGISFSGPWYQAPPKDLSKPEIQWYTFGFEENATFTAKAKPSAAAAKITIRGQACSADICKNIDVTIQVPGAPGGAAPDLSKLEPVR